MIYCKLGDAKMASRYEFTEEQIQELTKASKANKDKNVDRRLRALLMRATGKKLAEVAQATGYSFSNITKLVRTYRGGGVSAIVENHYGGNHRNMSYEEEAALLEPFRKEAEAGQIVHSIGFIVGNVDKAIIPLFMPFFKTLPKAYIRNYTNFRFLIS